MASYHHAWTEHGPSFPNNHPEAAKIRLHYACRFNDFGEVKDILDRDPALASCANPHTGDTPLHIVASLRYSGYREIMTYLLCKGADVWARSRGGITPFHTLAGSRYAACHDMVVRLVSVQPDLVGCLDDGGRTPVHYAAQTGLAQCIGAMLTTHNVCNFQDNRGRTPLHDAAEHANHPACVQLLRFGADPGITCSVDMTPLDVARLHPSAASHGDRHATVELLKEHTPLNAQEIERAKEMLLFYGHGPNRAREYKQKNMEELQRAFDHDTARRLY